jgi:hypothetical protein
MRLTPIQKSLLENSLRQRKEAADLRKRQLPSGERKGQNPKWWDDAWFERKFGDPTYYTRIKHF